MKNTAKKEMFEAAHKNSHLFLKIIQNTWIC